MQGEDFLIRLQKRIRCRFIDAPEPLLHIQQHLTGIFIGILLQGIPESPVCLFPIFLRHVPLNVPVFVDGAPLMNQFLAETLI